MSAEPLDDLIELLESSPSGESRDKIYEAVAQLLEFHRAAFARILDILREKGQGELIQKLRADPLLETVFRGYDLLAEDLIPLPVLPQPPPGRGEFLPLVHAFEVPARGFLPVSAFDREILLCRSGEAVFALSALCPAGGDLSSAMLEGAILTCSCHGIRFDLRTGNAMERKGMGLERFPLRLEDGLVKVAFQL